MQANSAGGAPGSSSAGRSVVEQILDVARWAPSGDNTQPWRFEIVDAQHVVVHGFDTRDHCVYDLTGHPSQISLGALLETIAVAASGHGLETLVQRRAGLPDTLPTFDVRLVADSGIVADPLIASIPKRCVQRRAMHMRALSAEEKRALEAAVGSGYRILWLEGLANRYRAARLMFDNAKLRLTIPEAYEVHRNIIEWSARYSEDRVPDQALGADPITTLLMRWVMQSWQRVDFFNKYLAGTLAPRIQMDLLPGIACAAHFVIVPERKAQTVDDYVAAGRALQRFWLTATRLGLQLQPEMTPLIFGKYAREHINFTKKPGGMALAQRLSNQMVELLGNDALLAVFMGRIGAGDAATARSLRTPLDRLMLRAEEDSPHGRIS